MNALGLLILTKDQKIKGVWLDTFGRGEYKRWFIHVIYLSMHSNWKKKRRHGESKWWTSSGELWCHELYKNGQLVKVYLKEQT